MPRRSARPSPIGPEFPTHTSVCHARGGPLGAANSARRSVTNLQGLVRLRLQVRRCRDPDRPRHRIRLRPERGGFAYRSAPAAPATSWTATWDSSSIPSAPMSGGPAGGS
jgi:hypothetical protein